VSRSRRLDADVVAHIAEVDARRLYAREATPSMFAWCTDRLGFTEQEAYLRITVARSSRRHPLLLDMLRDGRLQLRGIALLARHLTTENRQEILDRAGLSFRKLQELAAELEPKPDAPGRIRQLPTPRTKTTVAGSGELCTCRVETAAAESPLRGLGTPTGPLTAESTRPSGSGTDAAASGPTGSADVRTGHHHRSTLEPLAPSRHRVQFTASDELRGKLERLQALMRSTVPDGDLAAVIDVAVTEKLERLEAQRFGQTSKPRKALAGTDTAPSSRHIPAPVRRAVHDRDGGRCTYEDHRGRRCGARERLEFHHHRTPFGKGGEHSVENLRLVCRTHNHLLAEREYGREKMARHRQRRLPGGSVPATARGAGRAGIPAGRTAPPP
jgi:hypothetical protein